MQSFIGNNVNPQGWVSWDSFTEAPPRLGRPFFAEYMNRGPGADVSRRVNWPYKYYVLTHKSARRFSVDRFIDAQCWITIQRTSPHENGQAVALRVNSDQSGFHRCAIRGNQDTLYAFEGCQFYKYCTITGTVDFIFGYAAAIFQSCDILVRNAPTTVVTANGRNNTIDKTGFVLHLRNISRNSDSGNAAETFLGRPWGLFSRTAVIQSFINSNVKPQGWIPWGSDPFASTAPPTKGKPYYREYMNNGP
ncbi:pectinesterase/pectinesterase inhibitor PPE8B-like [Rutidosis leptorrhynchoides]|uniref:pectinesterase/pectinesterase inhibitor PPE8B-like n=1 Tax=Rutidosis leptorrhynchoides TaxID=125765 RepID=UPI003A9A2411